MLTSPFSNPLGGVTPFQADAVLLNGLAWPPPLLQLTLPSSPGGPTAFLTSRTLGVMDNLVLAHEVVFRSHRPGLRLRPLPADPEGEAWRGRLHTSFTLSEFAVHGEQM